MSCSWTVPSLGKAPSEKISLVLDSLSRFLNWSTEALSQASDFLKQQRLVYHQQSPRHWHELAKGDHRDLAAEALAQTS